ncbi:MAG: GGDEF domain-containing protein, partial [Pseudomonadota bacterium]
MTTAGALAILPFGILRLMQARYLLAVIDLGLVAVLAAQVLYVYRTQRLVFARYAVCIACLIAGTGTIYAGGPDQAFWLFPMILITFSLLKPMESALMCLGVLGVVLPQLVPVDDTMALLTLLTTIGLTLILAYAFSQQTMTQNRKLAELATRDPLTGAGNRRALGDKFRELLHQQQRDTVSASMLVFDL